MAENLDSGQPVQDPVVEAAPEKTLKQSEVDAIVGRVRGEGREQGRREAMDQVQKQQAAQVQAQAPVQQQAQMAPSQMQIPSSPADIKQIVDQHLREAQISQRAQQIASEFHSKMESGRSKYNDFDKVHNELKEGMNPAAYADLAYLANHADNAADVMYSIGTNPGKLAQIAQLAQLGEGPAKRGIQELSQSLKQNDAALKQKKAAEPLGQISPSNIGVDNGDMNKMSVTDFRKMFR